MIIFFWLNCNFVVRHHLIHCVEFSATLIFFACNRTIRYLLYLMLSAVIKNCNAYEDNIDSYQVVI